MPRQAGPEKRTLFSGSLVCAPDRACLEHGRDRDEGETGGVEQRIEPALQVVQPVTEIAAHGDDRAPVHVGRRPGGGAVGCCGPADGRARRMTTVTSLNG